MTVSDIIQILAGSVGVLGFCVLFNIRGRRMAATVFCGLLSWLVFVLLGLFIESEPLRYFIVALFISLLAEVMARLLKTPTTTFITTALVPLIPGGSLYYTMASAFGSDLDNFVSKAVGTISLATALALGITLAAALTTLCFKIIANIKRNA